MNAPTPTELWADVSLLHRPVGANWEVTPEAFDEFTFDWTDIISGRVNFLPN